MNDIQDLYKDPIQSAKMAGLEYTNLDKSGLTRVKKSKKSFDYKDSAGKSIKNETIILRINTLGIPPAWKEVWISPSAHTHIQATGIDSKENKQYIYHEKWNAFREALKFNRLVQFAEKLPQLRKAIQSHLKTSDMNREKVISAALALMDELSIRIGNESYAEANKTYGLTTLHDRHVAINKDEIVLHFIGKSHKEHTLEMHNPLLAKVVKASQDIPGTHLFQYIDEHHKKHPLTSNEVNDFIKKEMNERFTAKDFRMWAATSHAYTLMKEECTSAFDAKKSKKSLKKVISCVAEKLGNTPAVCKAHYIHTDLQKKFEDGSFQKELEKAKKATSTTYMKADEIELKVFLEKLTKP